MRAEGIARRKNAENAWEMIRGESLFLLDTYQGVLARPRFNLRNLTQNHPEKILPKQDCDSKTHSSQEQV